jgi:hypothetical protein
MTPAERGLPVVTWVLMLGLFDSGPEHWQLAGIWGAGVFFVNGIAVWWQRRRRPY